jgi:hypothetical protein
MLGFSSARTDKKTSLLTKRDRRIAAIKDVFVSPLFPKCGMKAVMVDWTAKMHGGSE